MFSYVVFPRILRETLWAIGFFVLLISQMTLIGCRRGSCEGVACLNGGACRGGRCSCPAGFEGGRCEIKWTDSWTGNYTVDDRCAVVGFIPQYEAQITPSTVYPDVVYFEGFGDIRCEGQRLRVEGRLIGRDRVEIARQSSCNRRYTIWGSGWRDGARRTLTIEYYYQDFQTGLSDSCRATWVKF
ncbi:MAG: calcium-binding EGF-like domain-containing protein [Bacteroidia bacterium]|nr:calcium-binding EGF-like domain-containing protein [Bacteroidia bacterium]